MLGENVLHVGKYRGQTFPWYLENAVGYSAWLVASSMAEKSQNSTLLLNKASFRLIFVISGLATNIRPGVPGVNYLDVTVTRQLVSKVPLSTTYRDKMSEALEFAPVNKRKRPRNHCATCGLPKTKETGQSCLYGYVFYPENVEGLTISQWRATVLSKMKQ